MIAGNPNHPKKGSQIKVDPIKKLKDIKAIKKILAHKPRDFALFTIGINTNLRASDLLRLKVGQVSDLKAGDAVEIKEKKTSKKQANHIEQNLHQCHTDLVKFKAVSRW